MRRLKHDKNRKVIQSICSLQAVHEVSLKISDNSIFGLAGTNGAGKSTLLRMMAGVLKPDSGDIFIDNKPVYENPSVKEEIFFLFGCGLFFQNATMKEMVQYYSMYYRNMIKTVFINLFLIWD